ncbi:hypothetical protein SERLA73DRAFT_189248 [Serpula lacrymans var. lacrymans S7.3]|uniref:Uncharacterized protein n=2 Tax=Serpula lacrymans var. lacrymans TaxID=341189 RepID=F8QD71_SERL3|nr:uncharacterized protein SERLADRAFT_479978 [Serpula lacrymans var. lacrymans S7.9]EGN93542.1 hypothetical protein SERLA73DRAFT_189248 [Serpula lacrymans var. lacrymans S7.3]EGO18919.1 hypothetical protein SERLADRAFT_479978 [Serpula lacrymans var. lacrymans S7.9]
MKNHTMRKHFTGSGGFGESLRVVRTKTSPVIQCENKEIHNEAVISLRGQMMEPSKRKGRGEERPSGRNRKNEVWMS